MTCSWSCLLCLVITIGLPAIAQDRMPKIPPDKLTEAQKQAADEFRAAQQARTEACRDPKMDPSKCTPAYFDVHGPMVPLLRSPEIMVAANAMDNYLEFKTVLPPELREFVILITAREWTQQYVWNSHYTSAIKNGLSPEIVKEVNGRVPVFNSAMMSDESPALAASGACAYHSTWERHCRAMIRIANSLSRIGTEVSQRR